VFVWLLRINLLTHVTFQDVCIYIVDRLGFVLIRRVVWWLLCIDFHTHVTLQCVCVCILDMYGFFAEIRGFSLLVYRDLVLKYKAFLLLDSCSACVCVFIAPLRKYWVLLRKYWALLRKYKAVWLLDSLAYVT